jgi:queuine tRNA-ribosyltransferase
MLQYFKSKSGKLPLPLFFPDATRAVLRTVDSVDIKNTKTPGVLVNTYHLYQGLGGQVIKNHSDVAGFMGWDGAVISDSGGFQVMSLAKSGANKGKIVDEGVTFYTSQRKKVLFTPEKSIQFQALLKTDLMVVLDDFTPPKVSKKIAKKTVDRTVLWAKKCKKEYERCGKKLGWTEKNRPYLIGVVQGGEYLDLRKECAKRLLKIGFDGFGYGGWPLDQDGKFNYDVAKVIADMAPKDYLLYGLGIGKPEEIVGCVNLGYNIFDCVLPTRDARHRRLYVFKADSISKIDVRSPKFYSFYTPDKEKYYQDNRPVSTACDCLLCTKYSRSYLAHLWRIKEVTAMRLSTIHNLRFYSILMEKLQNQA